jgi:hypothetical protein
MGIQDPAANSPAPDPSAQESQAPPHPAAPGWAEESTVAIPLRELFGDDPEE